MFSIEIQLTSPLIRPVMEHAIKDKIVYYVKPHAIC